MTALLVAALLSIADPVGDAAGDGSLLPPTSDNISGTANFDLLRVDLVEGPNLTVAVELGALDNPADLPNGFTHPIVEIYLDVAEGGESALLPGSGMALPGERGWETALRITGDRAEAVHLSEQGDRVRLPVDLRIEDGTIVIATPLPAPDPDGTALFAIVGVYDPFLGDGWRPLSAQPSPWAFSSSTQRYPVVDLLAPDDALQRRALQIGFLPLAVAEADRSGVPWLLMMGLGVLVAVVGLGLRSRVPTTVAVDSEETPASDDPAAGERALVTEELVPAEDPAPSVRLAEGIRVETDEPAPQSVRPDAAVWAAAPPSVPPNTEGPTTEPNATIIESDHGRSDERASARESATTSDDGVPAGADADAVPTFVIGRAGRGTRPPSPADPARSLSPRRSSASASTESTTAPSPDTKSVVEAEAADADAAATADTQARERRSEVADDADASAIDDVETVSRASEAPLETDGAERATWLDPDGRDGGHAEGRDAREGVRADPERVRDSVEAAGDGADALEAVWGEEEPIADPDPRWSQTWRRTGGPDDAEG